MSEQHPAEPTQTPQTPSTGEAHQPDGATPSGDTPASSGAKSPQPEQSAQQALEEARQRGAQIGEEARREMDEAMAQAMQAPAPRRPAPIRGPRKVEGGREHRTGTVVSINSESRDVFLEFGPKELGLIDGSQLKDKSPEELPKKDEQIEVVIERYDPMQSLYHCVLPGAVQKADWELLEKGQTIEARVTKVVKGGLELEVAGHRAFMPASQVSLDHIKDLSQFIGEKMVCQVDRVDRRGKGNIVLSRRNLLKEERERRAKELREKLEVGQTVEGTVRKIMPFGVFVDLGGVDGLVHVSDLSHERIHPSEKAIAQHVQEGQHLKVQILKLDWENNRISLGVKQLQQDPFEAAGDQVVEGATLTGRVKNIADFGVFVEVAPGVEGLVHISELDWKRVNHPSDVVKPDEVIQVKVIGVDPQSRKISLSIKQLKEPPKAPAGAKGRAKGRGRGDRDDRDPSEILKETPEFRRLREKAKQKHKTEGGLPADAGFLGEGLGSLKL